MPSYPPPNTSSTPSSALPITGATAVTTAEPTPSPPTPNNNDNDDGKENEMEKGNKKYGIYIDGIMVMNGWKK